MKRKRPEDDDTPPWAALPTELVQDICSFLASWDLAAASLACRSWRTAACALVTHIALPLNHPLLLAGPARGWEDSVARMFARPGTPAQLPPPHEREQQATQDMAVSPAAGAGPSARAAANGGDGASKDCGSPGHGPRTNTPRASAPAASTWTSVATGMVTSPPGTARRSVVPLPRLRTDFPCVTHITLVHNAMMHRAQVHAALSTLRVLWPTVRGLSVHDSVSWDLPLDYSALGVMTHITSLELLFQGQGGMDEAGQPMYRASMPHLCRLSQLKELCMKWIIGYDVDSFLDFSEVYDLLASLVRHGQLRSLQFGGENINAEGAKHLASITTLETLNLVCDARPASPIHLLDLLSMPRLTRLELIHVCPDHAWSAEPQPGEPADDPLVELAKRVPALSASPLRCLSLSLSPRCQSMVSRALPLLPHLHSLSVRVTSSEEEEALCAAFRAMQAGPPSPPSPPSPPVAAAPSSIRQPDFGSPATSTAAAAAAPPLRSLRLETGELGADLVASLGSLTGLTSLQLPRGLPAGETVEFNAAAPAAAGAAAAEAAAVVVPQVHTKYGMLHLSSLGRLTNLRRVMVQLDSPSDTAPAFVDGGLVSVLAGLPLLESVHLSTWNLMNLDPSSEALGPYPQRPAEQQQPSRRQVHHHRGSHNEDDTSAVAGLLLSDLAPAGSALAAAPAAEPAAAGASGSGGGSGAGPSRAGVEAAAAAPAVVAAPAVPCLTPLPTWAWSGLRSLSLTHWPCVYGKLREVGPPQPGRCYSVRWDDLPSTLEALLLVRCQLSGTRPPPALRHLWLADCLCSDCPLPQVLRGMRQTLETLVLRWPSNPDHDVEQEAEATTRQREQLVEAVTSLRVLRTLGLGGIRCRDVPSLAPLTRLRQLMLEPLQPPRPVGPDNNPPAAQRDLSLLDHLMAVPAGALGGLRTLWLPNWAMPIKQLLQWQQMLQPAMPLVVLRVIEYDVVWTVPTPVMHVSRVEPPSSLAGVRRGGPLRSATAAAPCRSGGGAAGGYGSVAGTPQSGRRGVADESGGASGGGRNGGCGQDDQELAWWHIGSWTVQ